MTKRGSFSGCCLLSLAILVGGSMQVVNAQSPSHCTALVTGRCDCSGCASFRHQKSTLIVPPKCADGVVPPTEVLEPDVIPPSEQPSAESLGDEKLPIDVPPSFAEQVPFDQVPQDQSPLDTIPFAGQSGVGAARPSASQFAGAFGASASAAGIPAMLGDFCGLGAAPVVDPEIGTDPNSRSPVTNPVAGGNCRYKFTEFTNPCPKDRVFFTYHHYNNGMRDYTGQFGDADVFNVGIEKTIWGGLASIEARLPLLGGGLSSTQRLGDTFGAELGNLSSTFKLLLINNRRFAMSSGFTTIWPTGDDGIIEGAFPFEIENESVHVMPFLAMLYKPNNLWFHQFSVQFDFDTSGNTIRELGSNVQIDVIQDQTYAYLDYSIGRWLHKSNCGFIRGIAGITELHYSATTNDADVGNRALFADVQRNVLNITAGLHMQLGRATTLRVGGGAPLRNDFDQAFDSEITVQLARYF